MSHSLSARNFTCSFSSTPSATVFMFRLRASLIASDTTFSPLSPAFCPRKNSASNFSTSRGMSFREFREEYPEPKSSMDTVNPYSFSFRIVFIIAFLSSKNALSVSSISIR